MFLRRKLNKSGSVSVQIISKKSGKYKVKTIGSSADPDEIESLVLKAKAVIREPDKSQGKLFSFESQEDKLIKNFISNLTNANIHTIGPELIFGALFDRIGFNTIKDELFRHITIARLAYPASKLKTVDYLYRYCGIQISSDQVYRFLDRLGNKHKLQAEEIAYQYTKKRLKTISVVFYDMTTLYFEARR